MDWYFKTNLTVRILIALGLGFVVGLILNAVSEDNVLYSIAVENVFQVGGDIFFRALQLLVVPVVLVSLICGTAALENIRKVGRIGGKTVGLYLLTTAIAIITALTVASILKPGQGFDLEAEEAAAFEAREAPPVSEVITNIFPRNVFEAMSEGQMLQVIVFSILFGMALTLSGKPGQQILEIIRALQEVVMKLVGIVMEFAPVGVFCLIAIVFAQHGVQVFGNLLFYFLIVFGVLLFHGWVVYPTILFFLGRLNPKPFIRKMGTAQAFAFSTASSNATLPVTLRTAEYRLGANNSVASFTVPLGATINMDGTAIMQGVATIFIAQAFGFDLSMGQLVAVVLTAIMASIGTAGVPGVGTIMLGMVFLQVGLPVEAIGIILGVDRLLDMTRTVVNITGDATVTTIIAKSEGALNLDIYNDPKISDR